VSGKWGQRAVQILLSINPVNKEDEKAQVDETKCNATTWYGLMERLKNQFDTKIDTNVNYWTKQALELLEVLGIGSFSRFNDTPYIASIVTVLTWRIESWRFNASRWAMHLDGNSTTKALKWRVTP
jgi:hypothetical protein